MINISNKLNTQYVNSNKVNFKGKPQKILNTAAETLQRTVEDFEKMKKDIEIIAGEYITLEGDGDYDKASQLIATKGIVSSILQKDLDRIAQAGIPKDIYFQQGLQTLGL